MVFHVLFKLRIPKVYEYLSGEERAKGRARLQRQVVVSAPGSWPNKRLQHDCGPRAALTEPERQRLGRSG